MPAQDDPTLLLSRARELFVDSIEKRPNYTCLQTVARQRYLQTGSSTYRLSCADLADRSADLKSPLRLASIGRLRLNVAISAGREIFSWRGAQKFDANDLDRIIGDGTVGTGDFGSFITSIFGNDSATFRSLGNSKYSYNVSRELSHYTMRVARRLVTMGYEGTFRIDDSTGDLESLTVSVNDPPEGSGVCQVTTAIEFGRVPIGDGRFLLPRSSTLRMLDRAGDESVKRIQYSACREFSAESALRLDGGGPELATILPAAAPREIPKGLPVVVRLRGPIDLRTSFAGDPVDGVLEKPVRDRGAEVVSTGTPVRGRVMRMEERWVPSHFLVLGLKLDEIQLDGHWIPISLEWKPNTTGQDSKGQFRPRGPQIGPYPIERRRGIGPFLFSNRQQTVLGSKFQSHWKTD